MTKMFIRQKYFWSMQYRVPAKGKAIVCRYMYHLSSLRNLLIMSFMQQIVWKIFSKKCIQTNGYYTSQSAACEGWHYLGHYLDYSSTNWIDSQTLLENILSIHTYPKYCICKSISKAGYEGIFKVCLVCGKKIKK